MLINAFGLTRQEDLDAAANAYASRVMAAIETEPPPERPDFAYLRAIHRRMFHHLFSWAGEIRDGDLRAQLRDLVVEPGPQV